MVMKKPLKKGGRRLFKLLFWILVIGSVGHGFISRQMVLNDYRREQKELEAAVLVQEDKLKQLEASAAEYNSDGFIEKTARDRLGFVRADERVFVFNGD